MIKEFENHINKEFFFIKKAKLLIAISGGLDSVVLTHLCKQLELDMALAHCNFNLRGEESDADEAFVMQLAEDLDLELFVESFETENYAKAHKISTQMAARNLRYEWFDELVMLLDFDYLLTAHHADDNLETFLINLSRGTGLDGLTGIPEVNNNIVRPLLIFSRDTLEVYANEKQIAWREDSSNTTTKYLRNKLRHEVIPILKGINPQLLQNFEKSQNYLKDARSIIDDRIDDVSHQVIDDIDNDGIKLNIAAIQKLNNSNAYLYELLKDYGFTEWNDVYSLLEAQSGKLVVSKTHRLVKDRTHLLLNEIVDIENTNYNISENDKEIQTPFGTLFFDEADAIFGKRTNLLYIDRTKLKFPLTLRKWEKGDYFYPSGMTGKKKLSKYFKDEKFSLIDKENVWLLCSDGDIVWIINHRADNRFVTDKNTQDILKVEVK